MGARHQCMVQEPPGRTAAQCTPPMGKRLSPPVLIELLRQAGHQGAEAFMDEPSHSFEMTGPLALGTGWLNRADSSPFSTQEFQDMSLRYVQDKLQTAKPSPC